MAEPLVAERYGVPTASRSLRTGAALVGVAGTLALSGCAGVTGDSSSGADSGSPGTYADGTYTAQGSYITPESVETISVTVTVKDDVITDVEINGTPQEREAAEYQSRFVGGISDVVVGKDIDQITVSRVAGSSLTSGGFNEAIDAIKAEAAA